MAHSPRTCVIMNPAARSQRARDRVSQVRKIIGKEATLRLTRGPGDAEAIAERAVQQGYEIVVAAGGDGTINEVVNGLEGSNAKLGLLPTGTINVFAMELGIPWDLNEAWKIIKAHKVKHIDLATANKHCFVQLAGIGLDAQIVERTDKDTKNVLGPLSYLLTATAVAAETPPKLVIKHDGGTTEGSFVVIGNGRLYAGPFSLFTEADIADGLLDVCVFHHVNYLAIIRYLRGVLFGVHTTFSDVEYFKSKHIRVESCTRVPFEVDGELIGHLPCELHVNKHALQVIVP
ncbi:MAG: diacylglycerol kinase family protein [Candidatus Methylacidiphilales bacterium]